ncbi:MAG TPA: flagellin [Parvibaculum sp.]|uniref:flagellin n=1 Tax=Parvibaculum sp. TaxID=2024848 RepID=UPI002B50FCE3|nr:flagellin [Parvibaculum sp.]HMM13736.1 flagellin [Parvibaculum sp.]
MQISSYAQSATMRSNLSQIQTQLADLQRQLASGRKADSFAKLGDARNLVLALNNQVSQSNSYLDTINMTQTRIKASSDALTRVDQIASEMKTGGLTSQFNLTGSGQTSLQTNAGMRLGELVDLLNLSVADRRLFGGKDTQTEPVETADLILNGDTGRAGLKQVIAERAAADLGDGRGRLALSSPTPTSVSLAEDAAPSPFGFKLSAVSSTLNGATVTGPAGTPAALDIDFGASLPSEGDAISMDFMLPDGTKRTVTLTATADNPPGKGQFTVGPDATATAANFRAALDTAIQGEAQTTLKAASAVQAGNDFFSNPPMRVTGPAFATATAMQAGTPADTVFWYKGDTNGTAGNNFIATIGDGSQIAYGARADQSALRTVVQSTAVLAAVSYSATDANAPASYSALTQRTSAALAFNNTQSVQSVVTDLGLKASTLDMSKKNLQTQISTSQTLLDNTQNADPYTVATQLTTLVTQLQASYQVTSTLSKLSLVNYL